MDVLANIVARVPVSGYEIMARCRSCYRSNLFLIEQTNHTLNIDNYSDGSYINNAFKLIESILVVPNTDVCPDYVPVNVKNLFDEGAKCMAVQCYDASGTMFRKVLDASTRQLLPDQPEDEDKSHPNFIAWKTRKDLGLRLAWLFNNGKLPENLRDLATCVREDGNDAAHDVAGIGSDEAEDLRDFTILILESLYTVPGQIAENKRRRESRRQGG